MTDETGSTGGEAIFSTELPADAPETFNSPREAAEYFTSLKAQKPKEQAAESAPVATAENELAQANPESPEMETTEGDEENEPAQPAIDPPKSWTKDLHEHWANLDPVLQERIVARDREDQAAIKRAFNEADADRKAIKAEREATEKARQQYESQLPNLKQAMLRAQSEAFPDIKTWDDVKTLQRTDPFRYQEWDVHQKELAIVDAQTKEVEARQTQERHGKRASYEAEQNKLLIELVPEMADPKKANELRGRAVAMLTDDLGLKNDQLTRWMADDTGHEILSNAGIQKLIADGLKYRDIQAAPKAVAAKTLPPVQKPGTSKPPGSDVSAKLQALEATFNRTGKLSDAQALYAAQLESQSRRRAS